MNCKICDFFIDENKCDKFITECNFTNEKITRFKCSNCQVIFGDITTIDLPFSILSEQYKKLYETYKEFDNSLFEIELFKSLNPNKTDKYINWGCGNGWNNTISTIRSDNYNLIGYDIAINNSLNKHLINDINKIEDNSISGIISNNYVEHMQNPIKEFSLMNLKMKKNSIMIHATPCWFYRVERTKFHLFFLEKESLNILCKKTGFEIVEDYTIPDYPHREYGSAKDNIKVFKKI